MHTPESKSVTVAEAAALWIERGEIEKLERSTLREYRNQVRLHINPMIGEIKLARLATPAIEAFRAIRPTENPCVGGSMPPLGTTSFSLVSLG